jgi:hypothetical protein
MGKSNDGVARFRIGLLAFAKKFSNQSPALPLVEIAD